MSAPYDLRGGSAHDLEQMVTGRLQWFLGDDSAIHTAAWYYLRDEPSRVCRRPFSLQSGFWHQRRRAICAPMLPVLRRSLAATAFCTAAKSPRIAPLAALSPVSVPAGEVIQDCLVRSRRLELPRAFAHNDLNVARLPIPPRPLNQGLAKSSGFGPPRGVGARP